MEFCQSEKVGTLNTFKSAEYALQQYSISKIMINREIDPRAGWVGRRKIQK